MKKIKKYLAFHDQLLTASRHYRTARWSTYYRACKLLLRQFSPKEILVWDLLNPAFDESALHRIVSKESFMRFQARHSPKTYAILLEDKEVFYKFCVAIGLPIPETIAFVSHSSVWLADGLPQAPTVYLQEKLRKLEGTEIIMKPVDGVYGVDVRALHVSSGEFKEHDRRLPVAQLLKELKPGKRQVLQHRLYNHDDINALTGFRTLQCLRIVTALPRAPGERGRLMSASIRLSATDSVVNNFDYGRGGAIRAKIDVSSGRIVSAVCASSTGFGFQRIDRVAQTGAAVLGFQMPYWSELIDLLEVKSACFYPIRLIGWDVAITPAGPAVIEGNFWFDPGDNTFGEVPAFMSSVEAMA